MSSRKNAFFEPPNWLDREDEVKKFFAQHRVRLGGKIIDQHLERLSVAVGFRRREGANLQATLKG